MSANIECDKIPVRLPSGTKAVVLLPRPFTSADLEHMHRCLTLYVEDDVDPPAGAPSGP